MRHRFLPAGAAPSFAISSLQLSAQQTLAQQNPAPRVNGKPDLFYEPRTGDSRHDGPRGFCLPSGFPSGFFGPYPVRIVQSRDYLVMATEFQRITRMIPLDGRAHLKGIEPTCYGDSVGHWEGDTLAIDSTNFKRWSLDDYHYCEENNRCAGGHCEAK